ncbi:MAG: glyoxalase superfamily protein [Actinomycetota bacterium]
MVETIVPILKVADAARAVEWYAKLGFEKEFEERYSDEFPGYVGITSGGASIHLSERVGDATPDSLLYLVVADVDSVAAAFGVAVVEQATGREIHLTDPDGNRLRVGTRIESPADGAEVAGDAS